MKKIYIKTEREKTLESRLKREVEKRGGMCLKFVSPGTTGVPDRKIFMSFNKQYLVETKTTRGALSPRQKFMIKEFAKRGTKVWIVNDKETLQEFLNFIDNDDEI